MFSQILLLQLKYCAEFVLNSLNRLSIVLDSEHRIFILGSQSFGGLLTE